MMRLSVVIAAHNEEAVIGRTAERVLDFLDTAGPGELIVVDDGSRDRTAEILSEIAARRPGLRVLSRGRNGGKGAAIRDGVLSSRGDFVAYTDADLVYPIEGVLGFVEALEQGSDVAIASRSNESSLFVMHPRHFHYIYRRYLIGRIYIRLANLILGLGVSDTQAGFKCFRGEVARDLLARVRSESFAFDVEVLFIARRLRLRIVELPVYFHYRGEQSGVELVRDSVRMFGALLAIRRRAGRGAYDAPAQDPARAQGPARSDQSRLARTAEGE